MYIYLFNILGSADRNIGPLYCWTNNLSPCVNVNIYFNFHPLEIVSRYRDPQLQMSENYFFQFEIKHLQILNISDLVN